MKNLLLAFLMFFAGYVFAQNTHTIGFEAGGTGADWDWTVTENDDNPPLEFIANPVSGGINTTATVAKFTARQNGQFWALCFTDDDGEFVFDASNSTVKIMVYKSGISDVSMKFEGMSGAVEIKIPNTVTNEWEELTFDFSASIGNTYSRIVIIPDFVAAPRTGDDIVYFDNIQVPDGEVSGPLPEPTTVPPVPTHAEADVISVYSDAYTDVAGTNFNPNWGQSTAVTVDYNAAGNNTLKYAGLNYQGTQLVNMDVSGYEYFHLDFWTPNSTTLNFYLISPGAETPYAIPITPETWVSLDIPLSSFVPPVNLGDVFQFKVDGNGTVYFDNWYFWKEPAGAPTTTFKVDMSQYTDPFTNVYVSGSFNGWSGESNQLLDPDMDNIYEAEIGLAPGTYEYKFTLDNWNAQEEFAGGEPCTVTNDGFTNRFLEVTGSHVLDAVCWNSCYACEVVPDVYDVTLSVDMNQFLGSFTNVYISGNFNDWCGECNLMTDPENDGVYEITLQLEAGAYEYKFTLDNWAVQEEFAGGESCTVTNYGFTNRYMEIGETTTISTVCWNSCVACEVIPDPVDVTFKVDMSQYHGYFSHAFVSGSFNGWCGDCNMLTDDDMDMVYEGTFPIIPGSIEYKFTLDNWVVQEEFEGGESCTITTDGFTNRYLEFEEATVLPVVCWNSCDACPDYPAGWSGISSNLIPETKATMEDVFAPVIDDLVILVGDNGIFWPGFNVNTIGDWDTYKGYKVKFASGVNFEFSGTPVTDKTVSLEAGLYYIPVLSDGPASVEDVLVPAGDAIQFAFDMSFGAVYWPDGGIVPGVNGALETLEPGYAYLVKTTQPVVLDFGTAGKTTGQPVHRHDVVSPDGWNPVFATGDQHILSVNTASLKVGDIIGVFNADGLCTGIAQYNGTDENLPLVVYGDDQTTGETDGMMDNQKMNFSIYSDGIEENVQPVYNAAIGTSDGHFMTNGLSVIEGFKAGATGIGDHAAASLSIYPNPNNGQFSITTSAVSTVDLRIVNVNGQEILSTRFDGSTSIGLGSQPKGVYFVKISNATTTDVKKIVIE